MPSAFSASRPWWTWVLAHLAGADVCYRCVATYRRTAPNAAHERYELGTAGRFADDYDEQRELHQK